MTNKSNYRTAGNGVEVDINKPYYHSDKTVIQEKLRVIDFSGGFGTFQGGENYGKAFGTEAFRHAVDAAEVSLQEALGLSKEEGLRIIKETGHLDSLRVYNEDLFDFIKGISAQTQISLEELVLALNDGIFFAIGIHAVRDHILEDLGFLKKGCTAAGFNNGILGQNNDNPVKYSGNNVLVKSVDDEIMILAMGSPLIWLMGMSRNLAVVVNTIDAFFAGHSIEAGGLPDGLIIMNSLLSHKTVGEVIEDNKNTRMAVALSVTFADRAGSLASIEFNADQFVGNIILEPKTDQHYLVHTNHPRYSESYLIDTWFGGDRGKANRMMANSFWRQEFAESFLGASKNKDVKEIQQLFRTYPIVFPGSDGLDFRTTVSVIWNINEGAGYISPDRPDITDYERVSFDD